MRVRYPRTPHLPWSPGAASDDVRARELSGLRGREVVVTEKLDGENTTLYADGLHARSLDSAHHPSRAWIKSLQGRIGAEIPQGWRVCGENLYARHSIAYQDLESWFYGFSVWDGGDRCLDWDRTVRFLRRLGVPAPRVLWRGTFDERALRALRLDTARQEGYVVRTVEGFDGAEFGQRVAKWVRGGHVQTDSHWMHAAVVENGLSANAALWAVRSGAAADVGDGSRDRHRPVAGAVVTAGPAQAARGVGDRDRTRGRGRGVRGDPGPCPGSRTSAPHRPRGRGGGGRARLAPAVRDRAGAGAVRDRPRPDPAGRGPARRDRPGVG
ncbi:RNA ligase family protein, partial [Streptomyces lunaelactis]|uniref:RNA ligase family protein n=1 Tax=Streptomyces lunaelactis TaxID=1535768 RepID=UPI0020C77248